MSSYRLLEAEHFHYIYQEVVRQLIENGEIIWKTKEALFLNFVLTNPLNNTIQYNKNWKWCYAELFDRLVGLNPGTAYHFRHKWHTNLNKEGGQFHYSYGDIFKVQLPRVIRALKKEFDREAIISVWESKFLDRDTYNRRPCTLTLHFYNRSGKLHLFANMRSNDVINLLPYDVYHHTALQAFLASIIGLEVGYYHHSCSQYYWPKRREERNFGAKLHLELSQATPTVNTHFPWIEPRKSIALASQAVREFVRGEEPSISSIPDPYVQSLVFYITTGKYHE